MKINQSISCRPGDSDPYRDVQDVAPELRSLFARDSRRQWRRNVIKAAVSGVALVAFVLFNYFTAGSASDQLVVLATVSAVSAAGVWTWIWAAEAKKAVEKFSYELLESEFLDCRRRLTQARRERDHALELAHEWKVENARLRKYFNGGGDE